MTQKLILAAVVDSQGLFLDDLIAKKQIGHYEIRTIKFDDGTARIETVIHPSETKQTKQ